MNLQFKHRQTYVVERPLDQVESRLRYIVTRRWDDYAMDLTGRLKKNGYFCLKNKWVSPKTKWLLDSHSHITGRISTHTDGSFIEITTHTNKLLITCFYIFLAFAALELSGIEKWIPVNPLIKAGGFLAANFIVLTRIIMRSRNLVKKFEQQMLISETTGVKEVIKAKLIPTKEGVDR